MEKIKELVHRLKKELQDGFQVKVLESLTWNLPVRSVDIEYETIRKSKMDILMKMILIAFQEGSISDEEELSDILLVEPLFIQDLIAKMERTGIIAKNGPYFTLTAAGRRQLESGVFESEPERGVHTTLYSPVHQAFLKGEGKGPSEKVDESYRYADETDGWDVTRLGDEEMLDILRATGIESVEGEAQIVVSNIISASESGGEQEVPCIEFRLHQAAEDLFYARVWNTLTEQWDGHLEAELTEKEVKTWRKRYVSGAHTNLKVRKT
ncbi:hypothetical protein OXB_2417 [Bacillus sp. OxB-1]|uniref:hypothetical protein n=1 Tax=Bacillus sp. (strain OxB-1) TaxID=98228 RepID=UPI000581B8C1|nr:hypothetical protein [Bacillus sp. OxB-1]BAQ10888.1 hypothetical protein OXB_2417 [Bacillus sp. OxB-1]